mgnify:CR=1 FL=1
MRRDAFRGDFEEGAALVTLREAITVTIKAIFVAIVVTVLIGGPMILLGIHVPARYVYIALTTYSVVILVAIIYVTTNGRWWR